MVATWGLLSKYKSELYGFSIIWIILFHGLEIKKSSLGNFAKFLDGFLSHGNCAVDTFLFLSGIFLYFSLKKDTNIISFYRRRVLKLIFPFLIIDGTYWLYNCIYLKGDIQRFIENLTLYSFWNGSDKLVWFIALIVVLYALYPIVYRYLLNKDYTKVYILLSILGTYLLCYGLNLYVNQWFYRVEIALVRIPVFLLGCYCGKLVYENQAISKQVKILSLVIILYGAFYFYQHPYSLVKTYRVPYFFIGPSIAIWMSIVLDIINCKNLNKVLYNVGGLSLELYLSHIVLRKFFLKSGMYGNLYTFNFYKYVLICGLGAYLLSYIVGCGVKRIYRL